ncbi:TetR/AcrR family transcriptional regulator [Angustibacter sp. McL0619]|uniref:TetR/AcrR family transcriptional regulator n=1 Tax=Angustibacter sp. McL0619 TaxID=3415676 RepID=UPI003CEB0CC6
MQEAKRGSAPDGRRERWVEHRRERREEFVAGALEAVRKHGVETGLDEVAASVGVSKSVVYRHFADRDDLFGAVLDSIADVVLMPRILGELAQTASAPPDQRVTDPATIRRIVRAFIAVVDEEPQLYRFALAHTSAGTGGDFVATTERQVAQALAAVIGDRMRELGLDSGGAEVWAFGVVGMVQLATQRWFDHRTMTADALADYLTALVTGGLTGVLAAPGR